MLSTTEDVERKTVDEVAGLHEEGRERINQFGDYNNERLTLPAWQKRWQAGHTRFHMPKPHPMLMKYIGCLEEGRPKQRIFLPLCGKSIDLIWLAERGHVVVGNEGIELACQQFFEENHIPYTKRDVGQDVKGTVYQSDQPHKDITLYCCDFFQLNRSILGTFDSIWDRGSLAAIYSDERPRYCQVILDLMTIDTRYLLDIFHVDHNKFAGSQCQTELLEKKDARGPWQREWKVEYFYELVHLLRLDPEKVIVHGEDLQVSTESRQSWWRWFLVVTVGWAPSACWTFISRYLRPTTAEPEPPASVESL